MTRLKIGGVALGLMIGVLAATPANAWKRGNVDVLAVLPAATGSVEGLTVGPDDATSTFRRSASTPKAGSAGRPCSSLSVRTAN